MFDVFKDRELAMVVDLYRRAHSLRWRRFKVTHRSLSAGFDLSARRVRSVLEELQGLGLATIEHGTSRGPTRVAIRAPGKGSGSESQHASQGASKQHQNKQARSDDMAVSESQDASQDASQGASLYTRTENRLERENKGTRANALPLAPWMSSWRKKHAADRSAEDVLRMASKGVEIITGRPATLKPSQSNARPVLNAWRRLGFPEVGDPQSDAYHLTSHTGLGVVALLLDACKRCPHRLFRNDIRGVREDGTRWKAAARLSPGVVLRMDAPHSKGATIEQRIAAAREWDDGGRQTVPDIEPLPEASRASSRGPKSIAQMWDDGDLDDDAPSVLL